MARVSGENVNVIPLSNQPLVLKNLEIDALHCGIEIISNEYRTVVEMLISENHKLQQLINAVSCVLDDRFDKHVDSWGNLTIGVPAGWMLYLRESFDHAIE